MPSGIYDQRSPDYIKLGGWLFRHRTSIPLPVALALLFARAWPGAVFLDAGRRRRDARARARGSPTLGVHHIGVISRTRSDRLGPLVTSGPFALVRNPLYLGNIAAVGGFCGQRRGSLWLAPIVVLLLLALEYHAIVRWEEQLLESRLRRANTARTAARVPRWMPRFSADVRTADAQAPSRVLGGPLRGARRSSASAGRSSRSRWATLLLWIKARF